MTETNKEQMVSIPANEYAELLNESNVLACLYAAGVDSWEGYDEAMEMAAGVDSWEGYDEAMEMRDEADT